MSRPISDRTRHALALVAGGMTAYRAANVAGINLSSIYRALKRERNQQQTIVNQPEKTP